MVQLFRPHFPTLAGETDQQIHDLLISEILSLNGKPSMYQMVRFAEHVRERGGIAPDPENFLDEYQKILDVAIEQRTNKVLSGQGPADEFVVFGARQMLDKIKERGLTLIILSGTIEHRVKYEAGLLGLAPYFGRHIYGGTPDHTRFSKADVIARILREEKITGEHLVSFGDGTVEIECTKAVGGIAIGVASDENQNGSGVQDPHKRNQLIKAGADVLIADYREADQILKLVLGS